MASYIAIDWGSSNLRAWLYLDGKCVGEVRSESGVTKLNGKTPEQVFKDIISPWEQYQLPVIMAGMIGSNVGWISVPYLSCPARLDDIPKYLTKVNAAEPIQAWIVPGLSIINTDNCNVMRGEETQLLGAYAEQPATLYLMPGTHCKWVRMNGSEVTDFRTVMTGELHHLLMKHSLIGVGLPPQHRDMSAFKQGMVAGFKDSNIIRQLFEVRAARVLEHVAAASISDWLSGLLIGNEITQMVNQYKLNEHDTICLVGNPLLNERYKLALNHIGLSAHMLSGDLAFQTGIRSIVNELVD